MAMADTLARLRTQHVKEIGEDFCHQCGWQHWPIQPEDAWPCAVTRLLTAYDQDRAIVAAAEAWVASEQWTQADVPGCHNRFKAKLDVADALRAAVAARARAVGEGG